MDGDNTPYYALENKVCEAILRGKSETLKRLVRFVQREMDADTVRELAEALNIN